MFILQVIICFILLYHPSHSRSIHTSSDLGDGIQFSWELKDASLKMTVRLPDNSSWIAFGIHQIPFAFKYSEDIALITVEKEKSGDVSYMKTLHWDDENALYESDFDMYRWDKHGRQKDKRNYYFTIKRRLLDLPTDQTVELVWAYGIQRETLDSNKFKYISLTLDDPLSLEVSLRAFRSFIKNEDKAGMSTFATTVSTLNGDDEGIKGPKNKQTGNSKEAKENGEVTQNAGSVATPTVAVKVSEQSTTKAPKDQSTAPVPEQSLTDTPKDSVVVDAMNKDEHKNVDEFQSPSVAAPAHEDSDNVPLPVTEVSNHAEDYLKPTVFTKQKEQNSDVTKSVNIENESKYEDEGKKDELLKQEAKEKVEEHDATVKPAKTVTIPPIQHSKNTDQPDKPKIRNRVLYLEKRRKCGINPCQYSRCPEGTKCVPNYDHCTSSCKGENATETDDCTCIKKKQSWYDVFKNNENTVYFGVIGFSAFFTGLIVLCLACCCARKARKIPRTRKSKVSFYKVNDFDSSADEEIEFLKENAEDADDEIYTKNTH